MLRQGSLFYHTASARMPFNDLALLVDTLPWARKVEDLLVEDGRARLVLHECLLLLLSHLPGLCLAQFPC